MKAIDRIRKHMEDLERRPESRGHDLRLDLADLVLRGLKRKGWTQKQLAHVADMKESFVTRIVHSHANCTFEVAGRLLFALDMHGKLDEPWEPLLGQAPVDRVRRDRPFTAIELDETTFEVVTYGKGSEGGHESIFGHTYPSWTEVAGYNPAKHKRFEWTGKEDSAAPIKSYVANHLV